MLGVLLMRNTICSSETPVTFGGVTKTAAEWAAERGLEWQTVKMRRYRGSSWGEALREGRLANRWNERRRASCSP